MPQPTGKSRGWMMGNPCCTAKKNGIECDKMNGALHGPQHEGRDGEGSPVVWNARPRKVA